jgi:hypothetical protein
LRSARYARSPSPIPYGQDHRYESEPSGLFGSRAPGSMRSREPGPAVGRKSTPYSPAPDSDHVLIKPRLLTSEEPEKSFLQALIQITAAIHHLPVGSSAGAVSLLRRLELCPAFLGGDRRHVGRFRTILDFRYGFARLNRVHLNCPYKFEHPTQEKAHDYRASCSITNHLEDLHRYLHF